jgi:SAM-dependent methyltransferase
MNVQSIQNKIAWEYRAYEFWTEKFGTPEKLAMQLVENPLAQLKKHKPYFENILEKKIANLCGSNGRKAVPLAILGADVTVFDISEENKRYALELAAHSQTSIKYIVTDIYDIDLETYQNYFDVLYLEGGILHYFNDIDRLMTILISILKVGGKMILSDFHPLRKCLVKGPNGELQNEIQPTYFDNEIQNGEVAYKQFFDKHDQQDFPNVSVRSFTLSEIINAVVNAGFILKKFDEHRGWKNENIPWEFTLIANK